MAYFDRVDVYEIEADLRVTNRAAEEGRRTKTAGSDAEIHDTQREIMGAIGERRNLARTSAEGTLKDIDVKLGDIDLGASHSLRSLGHLTRSSFELVLGRLRSVIAGVGCAPMTKRLLRLTFCGAPHLTGSCYLVAAKSSAFNKPHGSLDNTLILLVPLAGLEPARPCGQQILSLSRLPIPPQGHAADHSRAARPVNRPGRTPGAGPPSGFAPAPGPCYTPPCSSGFTTGPWRWRPTAGPCRRWG